MKLTLCPSVTVPVNPLGVNQHITGSGLEDLSSIQAVKYESIHCFDTAVIKPVFLTDANHTHTQLETQTESERGL